MKFGKVYNSVPKIKDLKRGSIKNLRDVATKEDQQKKKGAK